MIDEATKNLRAEFEDLLDEYLPDRLTEHDKETRRKYLSDRQKYLCEIKDEVVEAMQDKMDAVNTHEAQMMVFTEVLKELLRERIMEIYRRNKQTEQLEQHERVELNQAYQSYKSIGGNNYIDEYYGMMCEWETIPDKRIKE
jgi:predicted house-cleaning noncanonical NTP pyrophosphatase (MazG superfamily)